MSWIESVHPFYNYPFLKTDPHYNFIKIVQFYNNNVNQDILQVR